MHLGEQTEKDSATINKQRGRDNSCFCPVAPSGFSSSQADAGNSINIPLSFNAKCHINFRQDSTNPGLTSGSEGWMGVHH